MISSLGTSKEAAITSLGDLKVQHEKQSQRLQRCIKSFQGGREGQQENLAAEAFQKRYFHVEGKSLINRVTAVKLICRSEVLSQGTVTYF